MPMIASRLEVDFKTVRRYPRADSVEQLIAGGVRTSKLDPFKPYLHHRLSAGARNATALHAEIIKQGYTGSYNTLERYLKPLRRSEAVTLTQVLRNRPPAVRLGHRMDHRPAWPSGPRRRGATQSDPDPMSRDRRRRVACGRLCPDDQGPFR